MVSLTVEGSTVVVAGGVVASIVVVAGDVVASIVVVAGSVVGSRVVEAIVVWQIASWIDKLRFIEIYIRYWKHDMT